MINDVIIYKSSEGREKIAQPYTVAKYLNKSISGATGNVRKEQDLHLNTCVGLGGVHRTNRIINNRERNERAVGNAMTTAFRARIQEGRQSEREAYRMAKAARR